MAKTGVRVMVGKYRGPAVRKLLRKGRSTYAVNGLRGTCIRARKKAPVEVELTNVKKISAKKDSFFHDFLNGLVRFG